MELGDGQAPLVMDLLRAAGYQGVLSRNDLSGVERAVAARVPVT